MEIKKNKTKRRDAAITSTLIRKQITYLKTRIWQDSTLERSSRARGAHAQLAVHRTCSRSHLTVPTTSLEKRSTVQAVSRILLSMLQSTASTVRRHTEPATADSTAFHNPCFPIPMNCQSTHRPRLYGLHLQICRQGPGITNQQDTRPRIWGKHLKQSSLPVPPTKQSSTTYKGPATADTREPTRRCSRYPGVHNQVNKLTFLELSGVLKFTVPPVTWDLRREKRAGRKVQLKAHTCRAP